jgi:nitrogen fixation-related uncharacterized protein
MSYQGYTNYATWLIQLELGDDLTSRGELDLGLTNPDYFREIVEEIVENDSQLAISYAMRFLEEVNWRELAKQAEEYIILELPWSGDSGTFDDLVADANKSWDDEDIQFLLDQNEEYLDKLSPDEIERLKSYIG